MIVGRTVWTQCTSVTDRQTDRITITKTVQRIASHGKNQVKAAIATQQSHLSCSSKNSTCSLTYRLSYLP